MVAEKKKIDDEIDTLYGLSQNPNKMIVQKSQPLLSLWKSNLTLGAFKILDLYLARINSHDASKRIVVLEKGEVEKALGVSRISYNDLKKTLKNVMQTVEIPKLDEDGFVLISLFEQAEATRSKDGVWTITLECTQKARRYIFDVDGIGYLRYRLNVVRSIRSRHTYVLFCYLESNRFRGTWTIDLDELKTILGCADTPGYDEYKRFSEKVLKKSQKELAEKSGVHFKFMPVKHGRNQVYAIKFSIQSPAPLPEPAPVTLPEPDPDVDFPTEHTDPGAERRTFLADAVKNEFSPTQMDELLAVLASVSTSKLPYGETTELAQYNYLYQSYCRMNTRDTQQGKQPIKNRFRYLLRMIQADAKA